METLSTHEGLTIGEPIRFEEAIAELCEEYGWEDTELLRSWLSKLDATADVVISTVIPADEEQLGVLRIANIPSGEGERQPGFNLYPVEENGRIEYAPCYGGYLGNLTEEEERELATLIRNNEQGDRFFELMDIRDYPVTPAERAQRKHAAEDPSVINEYITLGEPITFDRALKQICDLYSLFHDSAESIKRRFAGLEPDDEVEFSLLIPGNSELPNILQITKIPKEGEESYGATIYPYYQGVEEGRGIEYNLGVSPGIAGQLTLDEEIEYAHLIAERHHGNLRVAELSAIKSGNLTREEAAELRQAIEATPKGSSDWLSSQPERIQYLWDKSHYGFENIEAWRKWKEKVKRINEEAHKEYREEHIANRVRIAATLSDELEAHFSKYGLVPTDEALQIIEDREDTGWKLVSIAAESDRKKMRDDLKKRVGRYDLDFRNESSQAYDDEACHMFIDLYFARYGALEKIKKGPGKQ